VAALALNVLGALAATLLATLPAGMSRSRMACGVLSASALAVATYLKAHMVSPEAVRAWTRARSVSEALKAEIFLFRARARAMLEKYQRLLLPVPESEMKPQRRFSLLDGIRASAAYLKYKEKQVRNGIGKNDFEELPREVRFQLTRLAVNPSLIRAGPGEIGLRHWIAVTRRGDLEKLFDFRPVSSKKTSDKTVQDMVRRATIHTVRAMHLAESVFDDE
jgi:hypothetical protein